MKVLLISASPHREKSNTFLLAREVLKGLADSGFETQIIHLSDCHIDFCRHCEICHKQFLHCTVKDSVLSILIEMLEADGIILASPNYINNITAPMKALFDRSSHFVHCKRLLGKYIAGVVTSGSGYDAGVLGYLRYYAHACGAQYSGEVSIAGYAVKEKLTEAYKLGIKMAQDIKEKKVYPDQMKIIEAGIENFKRTMQLRKEDWKEEYLYWQEKGWL